MKGKHSVLVTVAVFQRQQCLSLSLRVVSTQKPNHVLLVWVTDRCKAQNRFYKQTINTVRPCFSYFLQCQGGDGGRKLWRVTLDTKQKGVVDAERWFRCLVELYHVVFLFCLVLSLHAAVARSVSEGFLFVCPETQIKSEISQYMIALDGNKTTLPCFMSEVNGINQS